MTNICAPITSWDTWIFYLIIRVHMLPLNFWTVNCYSNDRMVRKYQNDPSRMRLISKQFYSEKVFDDATSDQPTIRWRYRNYFSDNITHGRETNDSDSYSNSQGDSDKDSHGNPNTTSGSDSQHTQNVSDKKWVKFDPKQAPVRILIE